MEIQPTVKLRQRRLGWVRTWRIVTEIHEGRWGTGGSNRHIYGRITCEAVRVNDIKIFNIRDAHALKICSKRLLSGACQKDDSDENPNSKSQAFIEKSMPRGDLFPTSCHLF